MISTCPSCLNQVSHEEHLFEIQCECGTRFNPYLSSSDEEIPPLEGPSNPEAQAAPSDYSESRSMFEELKNFGESLNADEEVLPENNTALPPVETPGEEAQTAQVPVEECLMTSGDNFEGYKIESYLAPVSLWSEVSANSDNPLKPAFDRLRERAQVAGGNGILSVRWTLSPDSTRVLLTGIPVRCSKNA